MRTKIIGKPEDAILRAMAIFPYITGKQVTSLLYSEGSYRSVLEVMKKLFDNQHVERKPLPSQIQRGSVPYVYWLAAKGRHYLEDLGYDFFTWRYPHEMKLVQSAHLWHALAINDFLIAGYQVANEHPDLTLVDIRHDLVIAGQMQLPCRCDGWELFHIKGTEEQAIWLELDRGTEKVRVWKSKIESLLTYIHGDYENDFGTPVITVAVVVPFGISNAAYRINQLRFWTQQQLTAMQMEHEYDVFRFIALPDSLQAEQLYLAPCWEKPFTQGKHRLLDT